MTQIPSRAVGAPLPGELGEPFHRVSTPVDTDPGNEQTLITETIAAAKQLNLRQIQLRTTAFGRFTIEENDVVIGSGNTGGAQTNPDFFYAPDRPIATGKVLKVKFRAETQAPVTEVEAFLGGRLIDA